MVTADHTAPGRSAAVPHRQGPLGEPGFVAPVTWTQPAQAALAAAQALRAFRAAGSRVLVDPHLDYPWARAAAMSPGLVSAVTALLGPDVAVEGSRVVAKPYGERIPTAAHRDGRNPSLYVDPDRAVAAWLAFTEMRTGHGCLEIRPASHSTGYAPEQESPANDTDPTGQFLPLPLWGGEAVLLDMALEHRSASNEYGFYLRIAMSLRFVAPDAIVHRPADAPALLPVAGDPHVWSVHEIRTSRHSTSESAPTAPGRQATP